LVAKSLDLSETHRPIYLSMEDALKPWDINAALQEERLRFLAELALEVRKGAVAAQEPSKGDGKWGLGCRFYERLSDAFIKAAASGKIPWLTALRPNGNPLELYLAIGGCPIHYLRGDPAKPSQHHLVRAQEQYEFWPDSKRTGWYWLMVVESSSDEEATRVLFEEASDSGDIRHQWVAAAAKTDVTSIPNIAKQGTPIPKPVVGGPPSKKKKESDGSDGEES
jgi:hypothetical protein